MGPKEDTLRPPARMGELALNGASGRVARLLRGIMPDALWVSRADGWHGAAGARALICLGGVTAGDATALQGNTDAACAALEAARTLGVPRVMLLSSAAVYGGHAGLLTLDRPLAPTSAYGAAKLAMEHAVREWCAQNPDGPEAILLRLGNVVGADMLFGNLAAGRRITLHVFPDGGSPRRSYIGPASLARVFQTLANAPNLPPLLNIAAPGTVAMADLLHVLGEDFDAVPAPATAIPEVQMDVTDLTRLVPFSPGECDAPGLIAQWRRAVEDSQ